MKRETLALALSAVISVSAQAAPLISEGFDDVTLLPSGWLFQGGNVLNPTSWFQGNSGIFGSQAGAADSYVASNYLAAPAAGTGFIDNYLVTPSFSLAENSVLTFWARGDVLDGYEDHFGVLLGATVSGGPEVVSEVLSDTIALGEWTKYTVIVSGQGVGSTGRFAINYFGSDQTLNYFGVDTLEVNVPEPASTALFGIAMLGLLLNRRRKSDVKS